MDGPAKVSDGVDKQVNPGEAASTAVRHWEDTLVKLQRAHGGYLGTQRR